LDNKAIIYELIKDKEGIDITKEEEIAFLSKVCQQGSQKIANYYLKEQPTTFSVKDVQGNTLLHHACGTLPDSTCFFSQTGKNSIVKEILTRKLININAQNQDGNTPLHFAYKVYTITLSPAATSSIILLLEHGADPDLKNNAGISLTDIANQDNNDLIKNLIKDFSKNHKKEQENLERDANSERERVEKIVRENLKLQQQKEQDLKDNQPINNDAPQLDNKWNQKTKQIFTITGGIFISLLLVKKFVWPYALPYLKKKFTLAKPA
jgi:ankyrin repeat protein